MILGNRCEIKHAKLKAFGCMLRGGPGAPYRLGRSSAELYPSPQEDVDLPKDVINTPRNLHALSPEDPKFFHELRCFTSQAFAFLYYENSFPWCFRISVFCRSQYFRFKHIKCVCSRSSEMHRRQKCLLHKSGNLSLVPGSHRGGRNSVLGAILWPRGYPLTSMYVLCQHGILQQLLLLIIINQ